MSQLSLKLPQYNWVDLEQVARETVAVCIRELPNEIREQAVKAPCLFRRWHPNAPNIDPEAIYMLGEYLNFGDDPSSDESGVIALYIGAIAWYCEDEGLDYQDEVRKTFLHELGHHFGWDEDEVAGRGL